MKYFNSNERTPPITPDNLSQFLSNINFKVNSFGIWSSDHKKEANYTIDDIEFVFYTSGGSITTILGQEYVCNTNDLLILQPHQLYNSKNSGETLTEYYYIHFNVEPIIYLQDFLNFFTLPVISFKSKEKIEQFYNEIHYEIKNKKPGFALKVNTLLTQLIIDIIRKEDSYTSAIKQNSEPNKSSQELLVDNCIWYISKNLKYDCSINAMATYFNKSENYIYKSFIDVLKQSPSKYIKSVRMLKAKSLLSSNLLSIEEVSEEVGYSSIAHFSNAFKACSGKSPTAYRKELTGV